MPLPICLPQTRFGKHYLVEIFSLPLLPSPLTLVAGPDFELDFSPPLFLPLPLPDPPAVHPSSPGLSQTKPSGRTPPLLPNPKPNRQWGGGQGEATLVGEG